MRVRKYKKHILLNLGQKEGEIFQTVWKFQVFVVLQTVTNALSV